MELLDDSKARESRVSAESLIRDRKKDESPDKRRTAHE
jgi:hypothetical protein